MYRQNREFVAVCYADIPISNRTLLEMQIRQQPDGESIDGNQPSLVPEFGGFRFRVDVYRTGMGVVNRTLEAKFESDASASASCFQSSCRVELVFIRHQLGLALERD